MMPPLSLLVAAALGITILALVVVVAADAARRLRHRGTPTCRECGSQMLRLLDADHRYRGESVCLKRGHLNDDRIAVPGR